MKKYLDPKSYNENTYNASPSLAAAFARGLAKGLKAAAILGARDSDIRLKQMKNMMIISK